MAWVFHPRQALSPVACWPPTWSGLGWVAVIMTSLLPVWSFPYFPTQDGPPHLGNAVILRDYIRSDARVRQFYRIAWRPLPNWSSDALIAGMSCLVPPLVAEKLFVSLYVLGFAAAYRYFVGSIGSDAGIVSLAGVLLTFNQCLWTGFYNYCLSFVLYFLILGYLLRRWEHLGSRHALVLCALYCLLFLTHIVGFILTAISSIWIASLVPPRSWRKGICILAALAPTIVLALMFFREAHYAGAGGFDRLRDHLAGWFEGTDQWQRLTDDFSKLDGRVFGIFLDLPITLGMGVSFLYVLFVLAGFCTTDAPSHEEKVKRRALATLGIAIALLYFLVPDVLVVGKGGNWKCRLAPLPPLLWLACVRPPSGKSIRWALVMGTLVLLGVQLWLVGSYTRTCNQDLREFTSGREAIGQGRVLVFQIEGGYRWTVNPIRNATDYYCLDSGNINLGDHFAALEHSVVRLRPGLENDRGDFDHYPNRALVDTIVVWSDNPTPNVPEGFEFIFSQGRLKVLRRGPEAIQQ